MKDNPIDWVSTLANLGIAGVLLLMLIKGWGIVLARELTEAQKQIADLKAEKAKLEADCRAERKENEAELRKTADLLFTQVVPLMTRAVDAEAELVEMMGKERDERNREGGRRGGRGDDESGPGPSRLGRW